MGLFSTFTNIVTAPLKVVDSLLGGGSSAPSASASSNASSNINFSPTTTVNFDTEGLSNAYTQGSQTIADAFASSTQSLINVQREIGATQLEQDHNFFMQSYEQNQTLTNAQIAVDTQIAKETNDQTAKIEATKLQFEALQLEQLLKMNEAQRAQMTAFFVVGLGVYLLTRNKKK